MVQGGSTASFYALSQDKIDGMNTAVERVMDDVYVWHVTCLEVFHELDKAFCASLQADLHNLQKI